MENIIKADKIEANSIKADVIEARVIMFTSPTGKKLALTYELLNRIANDKKDE